MPIHQCSERYYYGITLGKFEEIKHYKYRERNNYRAVVDRFNWGNYHLEQATNLQ